MAQKHRLEEPVSVCRSSDSHVQTKVSASPSPSRGNAPVTCFRRKRRCSVYTAQRRRRRVQVFHLIPLFSEQECVSRCSGVAHLPQKRSNMKLKRRCLQRYATAFGRTCQEGLDRTLTGFSSPDTKKPPCQKAKRFFGDPTGTATRVARCIKRPYVALLQGPLDRTLTGFSPPDTKNHLAKGKAVLW